jgi:hypothetical protein
MQEPSPRHCRLIVPLLQSRDGEETLVILSQDRRLIVFDIAWGEDLGDDFEHITTNISPGVEGAVIDLFFTDEVVSIVDPKGGETLWRTDGIPNVR